jgi:hypothetical protein
VRADQEWMQAVREAEGKTYEELGIEPEDYDER